MAQAERKLKELKTAALKHDIGARRDLVVTLNTRSQPRLIAYGDDFLLSQAAARDPCDLSAAAAGSPARPRHSDSLRVVASGKH